MALLFTRQHLVLCLVNILLAYVYLGREDVKRAVSSMAGRGSCTGNTPPASALPPLEPREWTLAELRGDYGKLAGRDATRSLAAGKLFDYPDSFVQAFDDFLDLTVEERETVNEWVDYFYRKYPEVGIVVRVREERYVHPEDVFSRPGDHPRGGILTDLIVNANHL